MAARGSFDLRAALCFVAVAEERSFTRGARRSGMTQPSVSEAVRKLEDQLGFPLFVRPSRSVQLTASGEAFLASMQRVAQSEEDARRVAEALRLGLRERLRIGAPYASAGIPERSALFHAFMADHPNVSLEVLHGTKDQLLRELTAGRIQFAIVVRPFDASGSEWLLLHHGIGHFLVPEEDPLAQRASIRVADLKGRSVIAPARERDPEYFASHFDPLSRAGAKLVPAPENIDQAMESFARLRRLVHLRFGLGRGARKAVGDMVRLPIDGEPIDLEYALVRRTGALSPAARTFWSMAERTLKPATEAAASSAPRRRKRST